MRRCGRRFPAVVFYVHVAVVLPHRTEERTCRSSSSCAAVEEAEAFFQRKWQAGPASVPAEDTHWPPKAVVSEVSEDLFGVPAPEDHQEGWLPASEAFDHFPVSFDVIASHRHLTAAVAAPLDPGDLARKKATLPPVDGAPAIGSVINGSLPTPQPSTWSTLTFTSFLQRYNRDYREGSDQYEHRRSLYKRRVGEADMLNSRPGRLWTAGINHLSDWTDEELSRLRGWKGFAGQRAGSESGHSSGMSLRQMARATPLPRDISWAHLNATNNFHNQGSCGSCWAIASVVSLEASNEIHRKNGRTFSAQELVNCVSNSHHCGGSGGCDGATVELAFDYALRHGLNDNSATPYVGIDLSCSKDLSLVAGAGDSYSDELEQLIAPGVHGAPERARGPPAFGLIGWERLPENKYEPLMRAVVDHGPVAVSVSASAWAPYSQGIFDHCNADAVIDHAVTVIGYGKDEKLTKMFWLIQNSWSGEWGERGRIRILRRDSDETECGVDRQPELGTGCDGGPAQVPVCGMCGILYDSVVPHFAKAD